MLDLKNPTLAKKLISTINTIKDGHIPIEKDISTSMPVSSEVPGGSGAPHDATSGKQRKWATMRTMNKNDGSGTMNVKGAGKTQ